MDVHLQYEFLDQRGVRELLHLSHQSKCGKSQLSEHWLETLLDLNEEIEGLQEDAFCVLVVEQHVLKSRVLGKLIPRHQLQEVQELEDSLVLQNEQTGTLFQKPQFNAESERSLDEQLVSLLVVLIGGERKQGRKAYVLAELGVLHLTDFQKGLGAGALSESFWKPLEFTFPHQQIIWGKREEGPLVLMSLLVPQIIVLSQ